MSRGPAGKNNFSINKKIKFLLTFSPYFSKIKNDIQTIRENLLFRNKGGSRDIRKLESYSRERK